MAEYAKHKICFLGYSKLFLLAKTVIDALPPSDASYLLVDCDMDTQDSFVQEALNAGCEVFIAGPGNSARFQARYNLPLVEIPISPMDYALAVRSAYESGCRSVGVVWHRLAPPLNIESIRKLIGMDVHLLEYESLQELFLTVKESPCDGIVGTAGAVEAAEAAGKDGFLAYLSTDGIREACSRAAELARELWLARKNRAITNAVMNNSQLGIIVTDAEGHIEFFNRMAQQYTGLLPSQIRGRQLREFYPNLSVGGLLKSGQRRSDSYRQVDGAMMRCVQERVLAGEETVGVVMTLHPGAHNKKNPVERKSDFNSHIYHWDELKANSDAMKTLVTQGKALCRRTEPTVIYGEAGSGREEIAYCIHGGSDRADSPCITIDLATLSQQDSAHTLFGYERDGQTVNGLLADANGGSVVLKNLALAPPAALACIQQVLNGRQIFRPGMESALTLHLAFFTIASHGELASLSPDLKSQLTIHALEMPPLRDRKEDVGPLFLKYLSQLSDLPTRYAMTPQMEALMRQYSWPGNVWELRAASMRYVIARSEMNQPSPKARYNLLLRSIGEDAMFQDFARAYPVLAQRPVTESAAFSEAYRMVKEWMQYSNEQMADKLKLSRTTLWRILQQE